jgi:phage tail-like protein
MPTVIRNDPYPGHNFHLLINGVSDEGDAVSCAFSEITGLEMEIHVIEYRTGNMDTSVTKHPGLRTHTNLVCKRGSTGHHQFWDWIKNAMDGNVQRRDGSVILRDENQDDVMRWNFFRAWPTKYSGPSFNAANNEMALETLEVCMERMELET